MSTDDERPEVIPSAVDPDIECVRIDRELAAPPGTSAPSDDTAKPCPDGYLPRLRRRGDYRLRGKEIVDGPAPIPNPDPPQDRGTPP